MDVGAGFHYLLDCGDGVLRGAPTAQLTCVAPGTSGTITVRGQPVDKDNGATTYTATVTVNPNAPPSVTLTGPYSGAEGSAIAMHATASDPENQPLSYDWDFGDGSAHGVGASPSHACPDNGNYPITVKLTDGVNTTTTTTTASITNVAPTGTPVVPTGPVNQGTAFTISLASVVEPSPVDQSSLQYRFSCGAGFGPLQSSASFSCNQTVPGNYTVQLRVRDKDGGITTYSASVTVVNVAPAVVITNPNPVHIPVGGTLNFVGRFTDLGTTDNPWQARITWGAGQGQKNFASVTPGTNITGSHVYTTAGTYTVKLFVQDKFGAIGQQTLTVIVP
ncbi:MAG: PKD domain-containing protein [Gemmatimonadaceae bacterium]